MESKPLVSVVIAAYNMGAYVPFAIGSALDQTYDNIEVIVIDDGSTDGTRDAISVYESDPRVRYLYQENRGQAAAKNRGVRESRGDYVAFLDADDVWVPEKLELQIPLFLKSDTVGVVHSRLAYIDETGKQLGVANNELFRGRVSSSLLIRNFIGFGTAVVKRECFDRLGVFNENLRMGVDYDMWLRFSSAYEFDYIDRPLLFYRLWAGQMSHNCNGRYLTGIEIMKNFLRQFPGIVEKRVEREAWAHTYVAFGLCLMEKDRNIRSAMGLYARALRYKPNYLPAWTAMVRAMLELPKLIS